MQNEIRATGKRGETGARGELPGVGNVGKVQVFNIVPADGQSEVIVTGGETQYVKDAWGNTAAIVQMPKQILGKIDCFTIKRRKLIAGQVRGELRGGALYLRGGLVKNFTAFDLSTTPPTLIRRDYSLDDLRKLGAKLPQFYFDELGNLRGAKDELIMAGPDMGKT